MLDYQRSQPPVAWLCRRSPSGHKTALRRSELARERPEDAASSQAVRVILAIIASKLAPTGLALVNMTARRVELTRFLESLFDMFISKA
ncbi:hypothetical protein CES87_27535 [Pseudomonas sp. ERMR1:02]|nr:hypothetical protein CES87_27535 [Pseudomonas sp. ERMR1:02]